MKSKKLYPNEYVPLDDEERDLLEADGTYALEPISPERKAEVQKMAKNTIALRKQRVNIFLFRKDVSAFRELSKKEGIPYQTLIASVLHKYNEGRFIEK